MPVKHIKKHAKSYKYAASGIKHTLKNQLNIWVQIPIGILVIILALYLRVEESEMLILLITIGLVLSAEMINSSMETMMDVVEKKHNEDVRVAKDVAAGSVLILAIIALVVGLIIFLPKVFHIK